MTAYRAGAPGRIFAHALVAIVTILAVLTPHVSLAQEKVQLLATSEDGFGRLIMTFPARHDLPPYQLHFENGVLAIEFEEAIQLALPDVAVTLPDYVSIARVDPDRKGLRIGLRTGFNVNRIEAGERLFIDLMPLTWQGLPPSLPSSVITDLATRAKTAAIVAEQKRKAEEAKTLVTLMRQAWRETQGRTISPARPC